MCCVCYPGALVGLQQFFCCVLLTRQAEKVSSQSSVQTDHGIATAEKSFRRRQCHWTAASCNS